MEQPCTSTLDTFEQHEGQEKCQANIPLDRREGQGVVSPELNSTTYKETQEGVPEYNNEPQPDGNTTQRFLEAGDYMEFQTTQLPEEVESNTPKSLQNSNNSSGADYLLVREHMEEEQQPETKGTEVLRNVFVEENTGILNLTDNENKRPLTEPAVHESGHLSEDKIGHLLDSSMRTGVEYFEEEFETHFGSDNDTDKTTKDHQEELLVELEINEGLCEADAAEGETTVPEATGEAAVLSDCTMTLLEDKVTKMTETSVDDSCKTFTVLQKDITKSGFLKNSTETEAKAPEDSSVEIQDAGIDMEEDTCGDVEQTKETENITQKEIIKLQEMEVVAEITTEKETAFKAAFGLTEHTNTEAKSDNALDFSNNEMVMKPEVVQESIKTESQAKDTEDNLKHVTESEGGYTSDSISVPQDAIDEEILDLWIQTAQSEDPDDLKQQEEAGPGREMATEVDTSSGRGDLTLCVQPEEKEKEKEVEVKLSESQPFSDPNATSFTAELGFLDQSLDGWGIQNNNTQLLESSLSLPDSMLANASGSANTSELSVKQPGFEDVLIEETADTGRSDLKEGQVTTETGFHSDSVSRHLSQGDDELPEKTGEQRVESMEAETGSHPQTESNQELTKADDEPLETPGSPDSPDEVVDTDSGRSSETGTPDIVPVDTSSLNPEHMLLKLPSLNEPQLDWSEPDEPEPVLKRDDQPQPGDQVDARVLDFTPQRSRIAVKNRRVRPPKDPRSLLHKPSVEPSPSTPPPAKIPVGVPLGGLGIGIKLPGLGAGLPVLKKTQKAVREENHPDTSSQEPETKPEEKDDDDTPKRDTSQHKPKWMPPGHPGFGNPLMSELKTKLKKTTKE
ncbi:uncharacterized protein LOC115410639 isoform X2 [Sphaeramia orbicularis]|uniref:uncharacterized protein LOC115410639 isoform X2 n=1 Tax=Sphaeramia orbicularis TaxID=375764 RepID=UPI0011816B59|nr:uncharacterized protein LOC115410639 isoform X2 [Sphaeramia orbicularis]